MEPTAAQVGQVTQVTSLLNDIREAFARNQVQSGVTLMEQALAMDVGWEALTQAVGEGISGPTPMP